LQEKYNLNSKFVFLIRGLALFLSCSGLTAWLILKHVEYSADLMPTACGRLTNSAKALADMFRHVQYVGGFFVP
jgi:hypothetical protein